MGDKSITIDDAAGMSDEDFLAQNFPADASDQHAEDDELNTDVDDETETDDDAEDNDTDDKGDKDSDDDDATDDDNSDDDDPEKDADGDDDDELEDEQESEKARKEREKAEADEAGDGKDVDGKSEKDVETKGEPGADDLSEEEAAKLLADKGAGTPQTIEELKAFYDEVTAEFNANGSKMQVTSAKDIIQLKQMGAGFNNKMKGLKPVLKTVQMLENNGLMDEAKLNFLIDVSKGDKTAITQLLKDHKIDLLDVDIEKESGYKSNDYSVTDGEVELRSTLRDIEGTEGYQKTMDIVNAGNQSSWDQSSRDVLLSTPANIAMINNQMSDGTFAKVQGEVDKQRMLNQLTGVSDIDAYMQVGKQMQSDGKFATKPTASTTESKPKSKTSVDKQRRKKASGTKSSKAKSTKMKKDFNPLMMDDKDFEEAMAAGKFN